MDKALQRKLDRATAEIDMYLQEIQKLFRTGIITLVVRNPKVHDGDMIITKEDDLDNVIKAIQNLQKKDTH